MPKNYKKKLRENLQALKKKAEEDIKTNYQKIQELEKKTVFPLHYYRKLIRKRRIEARKANNNFRNLIPYKLNKPYPKTHSLENNKKLRFFKRKLILPNKKKSQGVLRVSFTFNNIFVNLADGFGNTILKFSAGMLKFRPLKKESSFAAYNLGELTAKETLKRGIRNVIYEVNGSGQGKKSFFRGLRNNGINISRITINPKLPHNGCRPPKPRRILY